MDPIKLTLQTNAVPVSLTMQNGDIREFEWREMNGAARDSYLESLSSRMRYDAEGKPAGVKKFEGMQSDLLSLCLSENGKKVDKQEIQQWPAGVVGELFKAAQSMNHLNQEEKPPKNV